MRTFIAVTSWLSWSLLAYLTLLLLYIRIVIVRVPPTVPEPTSVMELFWFALCLATILAGIIYFLLRRYWHRAGQAPGLGFWLLMVILYVNLHIILTSAVAPNFAAGDHDFLPWFGLAVGLVFLGLTFPPFLLKTRSTA